MSKKVNSALDRRSAIRFGAVGAAATAATAVSVTGASSAQAAAGQPVLQGRTNLPGSAGTLITTSGTATTVTIRNNGAGAAGYFVSPKGNGLATTTSGAARFASVSSNSATTAGTGAAINANGVNNTGLLVTTNNLDRFAVDATNLSGTDSGEGGGGGVWADGGNGVAIAAISPVGVPAAVSIGDVYLIEGHEVVETANGGILFGATSAIGPQVTYSAQLPLNASGAGTWDLTGPTTDDVDFTDAVALVSANSGAMPNVWVTVDPSTNVVSVAGGAANGTVSVSVTGVRNDWSGYELAKNGRSAAGTRVAKAKKIAARVAKRAKRG